MSIEVCTIDALPDLGRESPAAAEVDEEEHLSKKRPHRKSSTHASLGSRKSSKESPVYVSSMPSIHQRSDLSFCHEALVDLSPRLSLRSLPSHSSHQMVDLTPRPSSGYKKAPISQSVTRSSNTSIASDNQGLGSPNTSLPSITKTSKQGSSTSVSSRNSLYLGQTEPKN